MANKLKSTAPCWTWFFTISRRLRAEALKTFEQLFAAVQEAVLDAVDGARSQQRSALGDRCNRITSGSHRHASHHDRYGYRQKRVSSSRDRRGREGGRSEAISAQPRAGVLQGAAARALSARRHAPRPIIGRVNSRSLVTRFV